MEKGKKKEKSIETPELLIKGNIISWEGTMIQLSNVSCISTSPLELMEFPKLALLFLLGGLMSFRGSAIVGLVLLLAGGAWIYYWYSINEKRKSDTILNILMNSGNSLCFLVNNKKFLNEILEILKQIIIEGGVGKQNVSINLKGCEITGNAKVLNDFDIS